MKRPPALVIAAPRSGEGKTTVALGIMAALRRRGLRVQGFKVGPDYLDTGYQRFATGRPGRNLDLWMMGRGAVERAVESHMGLVDLVVVEGVMGLFDGHRDGVTPTSTAEVAAILGAPVVLVVDASRTAASVGPLTLGFRTFDDRLDLRGVVLNRWASHRDRRAVDAALDRAGVELYGLMPPAPEATLPARHLGLVVAGELGEEAETVMERLAGLVEAHVDLDRLIRIASEYGYPVSPDGDRDAGQAVSSQSEARPLAAVRPRIAVALDAAFAFYYQDNLDALERADATLVPFSPLATQSLPACEGLYLGGGYPELHAGALSANESLRKDILAAIAGGLPTYAECGGLLYLCKTLEDLEGSITQLVGAVPGKAIMCERLQSVGYREGVLAGPCLLGREGDVLRGHEFHYSRCFVDYGRAGRCSPAYILDGGTVDERTEGFVQGDLFASYVHLHFAGCPGAIDHWLSRCAAYGESRRSGVPVQLPRGRE